MSKVYVVNEPMLRDKDTGIWGRMMDLTPAAAYGELVFLLPAGRVPADYREVVAAIGAGLDQFTAADYLLPVGDQVAIVIAAALCARKTGGHLRVLRWDRRSASYFPFGIAL